MQSSTNGALRTARRRTWWLFTAIAATVVAALMVTLIVTAPRDENVAVVEDFFAALEERDVKTALSLVDPRDIPSGREAAFLKPEAVAENWSLTSAKLKNRTTSVAFVTAEFDTEGLNFGAEFRVLTGRDPKLDNPFITVDFGYSPLKYAQANDRTVPLDLVSENEVAQYALLPGTYTFYGDAPGSVEMGKPRPVDVFDENSFLDSVILPGPLSLKSSAVSEVQRAFDERLADCVKSGQPDPADCPFGSQDVSVLGVENTVHELRDLEWQLAEPPKVRLGEFSPTATFHGVAVTAGPAILWPLTLTGTGETDEGESKTVSTKCSIDPESWVVRIGEDGELELADYPADPERPELHTCGDFW